MIKCNLITYVLSILSIVLFLGCDDAKNKTENELLITKEIIKKFTDNPSNDFYTNCIFQEGLPIVFNKKENLELVKTTLNLNDDFETKVKNAEGFNIPDTLLPKLNIITQKQIDSLEAIKYTKDRRTIYEELGCSDGLLSITKPIYNYEKTKAYISLYFHCSGICEKKGMFILSLENNSWSIEKTLVD